MRTITAAALSGFAALLLVPGVATAKPCAEHVGKAKKACQVQLSVTARRGRRGLPRARSSGASVPTTGTRPRAWPTARPGARGARLEHRGNLNWYPHGKYRGPLGMYVTTQAVGIRITGYSPPRTWAEHVAVAVASHGITRGWSGWGCGGA
jgi:hypothetical protein